MLDENIQLLLHKYSWFSAPCSQHNPDTRGGTAGKRAFHHEKAEIQHKPCTLRTPPPAAYSPISMLLTYASTSLLGVGPAGPFLWLPFYQDLDSGEEKKAEAVREGEA